MIGYLLVFLDPIIVKAAGSLQYKVTAVQGRNPERLNPLGELLRV